MGHSRTERLEAESEKAKFKRDRDVETERKKIVKSVRTERCSSI